MDKRQIFGDDRDRRYFLARMRDSFKSHGVKLFAYCLMGNHFHLLMAPSHAPIGDSMHQLLTAYAHHFNNRNARVGHLFQDRFLAIPCERIEYFAKLVAYIHLNPVRAGLAKSVSEWQWSSHREFMGEESAYLDLESIPEIIGADVDGLREAYLEVVGAVGAANRTLEEIISETAMLFGLLAKELSQGVKGKAFTLARRRVVEQGLASGYDIKELAKALNCTSEALYQLRSRSN